MAALVIDPIPELSSLLLIARNAFEGRVAEDAAGLDGRARAAKLGDAPRWAAIYRDALGLLEGVRREQERIDSGKADSERAQRRRGELSGALPSVDAALQREESEWQRRLGEQQDQVLEKVHKRADQLAVVSRDNEATGETVYELDAAKLEGFWSTLRKHDKAVWASNNEELVRRRCAEALGRIAALADVDLRLEPVNLPVRHPAAQPRLKGCRAPAIHRFAVLGAMITSVRGGMMTASFVVGIVASQFAGGAARASLSWVFGAALGVFALYTAATVPRRQRQERAKRLEEASERVRRELVQAAEVEVKAFVQAQLSAIRAHLAAERARLRARLVPAADAMDGRRLVVGLPPGSGAKLGDWQAAIARRLADLEGPRVGPEGG